MAVTKTSPTPAPSPGAAPPHATSPYDALMSQLSSIASGALSGQSPATSATIQPDSPIWLSTSQMPAAQAATLGLPSPTLTYQQAQGQPLGWSQKQIQDFVAQGTARKIPGFSADMGMPDIMSAWDTLLQASWAFTNSNAKGTKWTPLDVMNSYSSKNAGAIATTNRSVTTSQATITSAADAKGLFFQAAQQLLGRAPTDQEVKSFTSTLQSQERANPTVSTENQTLQGGVIVDRNTTKQSGGYNAAAQQQLATEQAQQSPEYGAYQAATTYMGALQDLIGGGRV